MPFLADNKTWETEFALWGCPPNHDDTFGKALLYTRLTSLDDAKRVAKVLADDHGCTDIHIQCLDGSFNKRIAVQA